MCGGRGPEMPKPLTKAEMVKATDNRFENPESGVTAPSWKPDEVTKEKAEIEAAKVVDTVEVTPRKSSNKRFNRSLNYKEKKQRKARQERAKANYNRRKKLGMK